MLSCFGKLNALPLLAVVAGVWLPQMLVAQDAQLDVSRQSNSFEAAPEAAFVAVQVYLPRPRLRPATFDANYAARPPSRPEDFVVPRALQAQLDAEAQLRAAQDADLAVEAAQAAIAPLNNLDASPAVALEQSVAGEATSGADDFVVADAAPNNDQVAGQGASSVEAGLAAELARVEALTASAAAAALDLPADEEEVAAAPLRADAPEPLAPGALEANPPAEPLPALSTAEFVRSAFFDYRRQFEADFAQRTGTEKTQAALRVARLLMSQMLLPEANSFLSAAKGLGAEHDPVVAAEFKALRFMHAVLAQDDWPEALPEGWVEGSLWAQAARIPSSQIGSEIVLLEAVSQLQNHSEPVISRLLPELFDAALKQGEFRIAEGLLKGAREATTLLNTPVYHLMMGRLAFAYDMPQEAFDYYARAANGRDIHAQRARIAMADIAIARRDPKLLPALREILSEGVNQWRHDREALVMRARLAQVAEDLGDIPTALDIMGKIRLDHPGTPEAILAHERGALALAAFSLAMDRDEIDLTSYLHTLRHVEPFYRLDPIWPIARAALGRAWARKGLHRAAAAEFGMGQIDWLRVGAPRPQLRAYHEFPLAEAEARLVNFDLSGAHGALSRGGLPPFADLQPRWATAALQTKLTGAESVDILTGQSPERLRLYARAVREAGFAEEAHNTHRALADQNALNADLTEALHAVVIAHERGDRDFAEATYNSLQNAPRAVWSFASPPLLRAMTTPMPELQPLSAELSATMLSRSDEALQAVEVLLSQPIVTPPRQEILPGSGDFVTQPAQSETP